MPDANVAANNTDPASSTRSLAPAKSLTSIADRPKRATGSSADKVPAHIKKSDRRRHQIAKLRFLSQRLIAYLAIGLLSLIANFILPRFSPGNPAQKMIQDITNKTGMPPSPQQIQSIFARYGDPNENVLLSFFRYMSQTLHGDFGLSIQFYPVTVSELIGKAVGWTIYLALASTIIGWLVGTYFGARLGWKPGGRIDSIATPIAMFFSSIPAFWLGLLIVWFASYRNGWLPSQGAYNDALQFNLSNPTIWLSIAIYSILPMLTLVLVGFASWLFQMRNMMVTTVNEDYVQLARAKGLSQRNVLQKYAARNALLPNFTGLAQSIGGSLTAVVLAESVFIYPGVGGLLGAAQGTRDYPVMQAVMLLIIGVTLVFNFIADSVYVLIDPRTREK